MKWSVLRALGVGVLSALVAPLACDTGGIVGGECRAPLVECDGKCIDVATDRNHCGACDSACDPGVDCAGGVCGGDGSVVPPDASEAGDGASDIMQPDRPMDGISPPDGGDAGDGSLDDGDTDADVDASADGPLGDGSSPDGPLGDGPPTDGPVTDGPSPDGPVVDGCAPPFITPSACGDCFTRCTAATPICSPVDGSFQCVPLCTPPLVDCGGSCVDTNTDPNHCGRCFNACPTGLCQGGMCVGATVGHQVLFCTNFDRPVRTSPQTTLLANAVFLSPRASVRILAYEGHSSNANEARVKQALGFAAQEKGRTFTLTDTTSSAAVIAQLNVIDFEVFLVYDQPNAPAGTLAMLGTQWAATLDAFSRAGGTVVVLGSTNGVNQMDRLLATSGMLPGSSPVAATFSVVHNRAPADAVGLNVPTPFLALTDSCTFTTTATPSGTTVFVITDTDPSAGSLGRPMVVHGVKLP